MLILQDCGKTMPGDSKAAKVGKEHIWGFRKMGGTPKSSIFSGMFHHKPSILGYPHDYGNPHSYWCLAGNGWEWGNEMIINQ